MVSNDWTGVLI